MIRIEDWIMIKHLHQQGVPKARIARELGVDRKTVQNVIRTDICPTQVRLKHGSILDPYKDYIRERVSKYDLTATRILREIRERGYPGSYTIVKDYVRRLKGERPKPAYVRCLRQGGRRPAARDSKANLPPSRSDLRRNPVNRPRWIGRTSVGLMSKANGSNSGASQWCSAIRECSTSNSCRRRTWCIWDRLIFVPFDISPALPIPSCMTTWPLLCCLEKKGRFVGIRDLWTSRPTMALFPSCVCPDEKRPKGKWSGRFPKEVVDTQLLLFAPVSSMVQFSVASTT